MIPSKKRNDNHNGEQINIDMGVSDRGIKYCYDHYYNAYGSSPEF